jgi:hypothetical protein
MLSQDSQDIQTNAHWRWFKIRGPWREPAPPAPGSPVSPIWFHLPRRLWPIPPVANATGRISRAACALRKSDIKRAVAVAKAAGAGRVELDPATGKIVIVIAGEDGGENADTPENILKLIK